MLLLSLTYAASAADCPALALDPAPTLALRADATAAAAGEVATVYLEVRNPTPRPLRIVAAEVVGDEIGRTDADRTPLVGVLGGDGTLASNQVAVFVARPRMASRVRPGPHTLYASLEGRFVVPPADGAADASPCIHPIRLVDQTEVTVDVAGLQPLLGIFGLPTLVLLPGFVLLTGLGLTQSLADSRIRDWRKKLPLDGKHPGFWFLTVVISLAISTLYSWVATDFPEAYGFADVAILAGMGVLLAALVSAGWLRQAAKARAAALTRDAAPLDLLRWLAARRGRRPLPDRLVDLEEGDGVIEAIELGGGWYAGPIEARFDPTDATPELLEAWVTLHASIDGLSASEVAEQLGRFGDRLTMDFAHDDHALAGVETHPGPTRSLGIARRLLRLSVAEHRPRWREYPGGPRPPERPGSKPGSASDDEPNGALSRSASNPETP